MKISNEVLDILSRSRIEENMLFLPDEQLDRKMYQAVNKCIVNIGGKWNRKAKAHIFDHDPSDDLDSMLLTGEMIDMKKIYQFFPTPKKIAEKMCDLAELTNRCTVLEPSCGRGDLADVIYSSGVGSILAIELNPDMQRYLSDKPYKTETGIDFLEFAKQPDNHSRFDRIIMNPPFSKHQDVDHILTAYELLESNGILVSVISPSPFFREDKKSVMFRSWMQEINAEVIDVPEGAFKESGTMIRTKIIKVCK